MGRVLAIDVGGKRCGLAVTDPLQLSVNPIGAVHPNELIKFISDYLKDHELEVIVLGLSKKIDGSDNEIMKKTRDFEKQIQNKFPSIQIDYQDEYNSSREAVKLMVEMGVKKKDRRKKENVDVLSASIILQRYLGNI